MGTHLGAGLEGRGGGLRSPKPQVVLSPSLLTKPEAMGKIQLKRTAWESLEAGHKKTSLRGSPNFCTAKCQGQRSMKC